MTGETTVWKGQPHQGLLLRPIDAFLIPFSLLWSGFAAFLIFEVWSSGAPLFSQLFGLPFLVFGAYGTFGRFLLDIYLRRATSYTITTERVVIVRGSKTVSLDIRHLPALELTELSDGSGTIRFGPATSVFDGRNFAIWQPSSDPVPQFLRIPRARSVYELIRKQAGR
ncbi:hypothetical protein [Erythrobacter sp. CCH5-A1]|jgi:hypothetical protein|uniref:hypothetical protein n=1 Tax=Erythrobacter sp. CCH5-A1 TaxID=1768792 RepID=UPI00083434A2|nr:hypothetical protein [Erythrobacter sp. CCH5-A1]